MAFNEPLNFHSILREATYVCQCVQMIRMRWALLLLAYAESGPARVGVQHGPWKHPSIHHY